MTIDPNDLKKLDAEALHELKRISQTPGPSPDLIPFADLWDYGLLSGGHDHAEITKAGRDYLRKHW